MGFATQEPAEKKEVADADFEELLLIFAKVFVLFRNLSFEGKCTKIPFLLTLLFDTQR